MNIFEELEKARPEIIKQVTQSTGCDEEQATMIVDRVVKKRLAIVLNVVADEFVGEKVNEFYTSRSL